MIHPYNLFKDLFLVSMPLKVKHEFYLNHLVSTGIEWFCLNQIDFLSVKPKLLRENYMFGKSLQISTS